MLGGASMSKELRGGPVLRRPVLGDVAKVIDSELDAQFIHDRRPS